MNVPYTINPGEREDQLEWQGGACWICNRDSALVVDHDHATGAKRGLLCQSCNLRVAWIDQNIDEVTRYGLPPTRRDFVARAIVSYVRSGGVWDVRLLDPSEPRDPIVEPEPQSVIQPAPESRPGSMSMRTGGRFSVRWKRG